jgi:hypothetical protein
MSLGRLWEDGLSKNKNSNQWEDNWIPPSKQFHFPLSVQLAGHNIAAEHTNLAPFRISITSNYHQIREITRYLRSNHSWLRGFCDRSSAVHAEVASHNFAPPKRLCSNFGS